MRKSMIRFVSLILALTFITGQVQAGEISSSYSLGIGELTPGRDASIKDGSARLAKPDAIANGELLREMLNWKTELDLPARISLKEGTETERRLRETIQLALGLSKTNKDAVVKKYPQHKKTVEDAHKELLDLGTNLKERIWLHNAAIKAPKNYRLGFRFNRYKGLTIELVDYLYNISPKLLAQYIYRESVPEKDVTIKIIKRDGRDAHRTIYTEIEGGIFGEPAIEAFRKGLRDLINEKVGGNQTRTVSITRIHALVRPLGETFIGLPDISEIPRDAAWAVYTSGNIGKGDKDAIDASGTAKIREELESLAKKYDVTIVIVNGEGLKDVTTETLEQQKKTRLFKGETFGTGKEIWYVAVDPIDGTGNAAEYKEGKEGRTASVIAIGREVIPVPDKLRAFALAYNDGGKNVRFDLSSVARNEDEIQQGKVSLEKALTGLVKEYSGKTGIGLNDITVHIMGNPTFNLPIDKQKPHRHQRLYDSVRQLGVNIEIFGAGTVTPMEISAIHQGHIYMMIAAATETFMTGQAVSQLPNTRVYMQLVSDNGFHEVKKARLDPDNGLQLYEKASKDRTRTDMNNRFAFSASDAELLWQEKVQGSEEPYYSPEMIKSILAGEHIWSTDKGNIPPLNLYQTLLLPSGYKFKVLGEDAIEDKGVIENPDGAKTVLTLIIENHGAILREEKVATRTASYAKGHLRELVNIGTKYWLDSVDPGLIAREIQNGATGATSNPIIISDLVKKVLANIERNGEPRGEFEKGIYAILVTSKNEEMATKEITKFIVVFAAAKFRDVYNATNKNDGYVSIEVDPRIEDKKEGPFAAMNHEERVAEVVRQGVEFSRIAPNVMVKVPATAVGLEALEELAYRGVSLNVTLIFTPEQARIAREAVYRGLKRRKAEGKSVDIKTVYSVFVSRVDDYTAKKVPQLGQAQGELGIYISKIIYMENEEFWQDKGFPLEHELIFASTGNKETKVSSIKTEEQVANAASELQVAMGRYVYNLAGGNIQTNPPLTAYSVNIAPKEITERTVEILPSVEIRNILNIYLRDNTSVLHDVLMAEGIEKFVKPQVDLVNTIKAAKAARKSTLLPVSESAYRASLPISGKKILQQAIKLGRPVIAANIDNGELSALQIPAIMEAAREMNASIIFEVGPGALKTYAKGKPQLPEYSAKEALDIYRRTGYSVTYGVHLDHNQIDPKRWKEDKAAALQEAIDRAKFALANGFTFFATDSSTITDLEKQEVTERLRDVINTAAEIMRTIYRGARELGIEVGNEGEVGDIGRKVSTVEEALAYYQGLVEKLSDLSKELGIDFSKEPLIDVIALNLGTSHGYDFDSQDIVKPYTEGTINLQRAKEVAEAFKKLGLNVGVALHGFSGTPVEIAPQFIGTGIAKVNINTDWQAISWKVLQAYYPELYREVFDEAKAQAEIALQKLKDEERKLIEKKAPEKKLQDIREKITTLEKLLAQDMERSRNRIIFGKEGAPGIRNFFRNPKEGWALLEKITLALSQGTERRRLIPRTDEEAREDYLKVQIATEPDAKGLTSSEALFKLTNERILELMKALHLQGSAVGINAEREKLVLQEWQRRELSARGDKKISDLATFAPLRMSKPINLSDLHILPGYEGIDFKIDREDKDINLRSLPPLGNQLSSQIVKEQQVHTLLQESLSLLKEAYTKSTNRNLYPMGASFTTYWQERYVYLREELQNLVVTDLYDDVNEVGAVSARHAKGIVWDEKFLVRLAVIFDQENDSDIRGGIIQMVAERLLHELFEDGNPQGKTFNERIDNEFRAAKTDSSFLALRGALSKEFPNNETFKQKNVDKFLKKHGEFLRFRSGYYYKLLRQMPLNSDALRGYIVNNLPHTAGDVSYFAHLSGSLPIKDTAIEAGHAFLATLPDDAKIDIVGFGERFLTKAEVKDWLNKGQIAYIPEEEKFIIVVKGGAPTSKDTGYEFDRTNRVLAQAKTREYRDVASYNLSLFTRPDVFRKRIGNILLNLDDNFKYLEPNEKKNVLYMLSYTAYLLSSPVIRKYTLLNPKYESKLRDKDIDTEVAKIIGVISWFERENKDIAQEVLKEWIEKLNHIQLKDVKKPLSEDNQAIGLLAELVKSAPKDSLTAWTSYWHTKISSSKWLKTKTVTGEISGNDYGPGTSMLIAFGVDLVMMNPTLAIRALAENKDLQNKVDKFIAQNPNLDKWSLLAGATKIAGSEARMALRPIFHLTQGQRGRVSFQVNARNYNNRKEMLADILRLGEELDKEAEERDKQLFSNDIITEGEYDELTDEELYGTRGDTDTFFKVDSSSPLVYGRLEEAILENITSDGKLDLAEVKTGGVIEEALSQGRDVNGTVAGHVADSIALWFSQMIGHRKAAKKDLQIHASIITQMLGRVEASLRWIAIQKVIKALESAKMLDSDKQFKWLQHLRELDIAKNGTLDDETLRQTAEDVGIRLPSDRAIRRVGAAILQRSNEILNALFGHFKGQGVKPWETGLLVAATREPYYEKGYNRDIFPHFEYTSGSNIRRGWFPKLQYSIESMPDSEFEAYLKGLKEFLQKNPNGVYKTVEPELIKEVLDSSIGEDFRKLYEPNQNQAEILARLGIYKDEWGTKGLKVEEFAKHPFAQQTLFGKVYEAEEFEYTEKIPETEEEKDAVKTGFVGDVNTLANELEAKAEIIRPKIETLDATLISQTEGLTGEMSRHLSVRPQGKIDLTNYVVIMKKDLSIAAAGTKNTTLNEILKGQYQSMKQDLRRLFSGEQGVIDVQTRDDLITQANVHLGLGQNVIILDDGTLTQGLEKMISKDKKAGEDYSVIIANPIQNLKDIEIPFVNLNAMALMGVGVLYDDAELFKLAYKTFTGKDAPQNFIKDLTSRVLWLISALPKIVRFTDEIQDSDKFGKLVKASA